MTILIYLLIAIAAVAAFQMAIKMITRLIIAAIKVTIIIGLTALAFQAFIAQ